MVSNCLPEGPISIAQAGDRVKNKAKKKAAKKTLILLRPPEKRTFYIYPPPQKRPLLDRKV